MAVNPGDVEQTGLNWREEHIQWVAKEERSPTGRTYAKSQVELQGTPFKWRQSMCWQFIWAPLQRPVRWQSHKCLCGGRTRAKAAILVLELYWGSC